jgi:Zn-dependent metalloprotease
LAPKRRTVAEFAGLETLHFQARFQGLEVVGSGTLQHVNQNGEAHYTNRLAQFDLDTRPAISREVAAALARALHEDSEVLSSPMLKVLPDDGDLSARLTWWTKVRDLSGHREAHQVVVDAHSGEVIADISTHLSISPIHVFEANAACQEVEEHTGAPLSLELTNCYQSVNAGRMTAQADESSVRALRNTKQALNYYSDHFGRDGIDGQNSDVVAIVHVGERFDNAFWDGENQMMAYGDGDGQETGDFTLAVDVAGHEMTHGVISSTANLIYFGESGALNEAYADFFGTMIENSGEWTMGTELFLKPSPTAAIRNLKTPGALQASYRDEAGKVMSKPYPRTMSEKFTTSASCSSAKNDNCFVHLNSTIPGHTSYQLVQLLGQQRAEQLIYITLTQYLTEKATFVQNKDATLQACRQLYSKATCTQVAAVFSAQGI